MLINYQGIPITASGDAKSSCFKHSLPRHVGLRKALSLYHISGPILDSLSVLSTDNAGREL